MSATSYAQNYQGSKQKINTGNHCPILLHQHHYYLSLLSTLVVTITRDIIPTNNKGRPHTLDHNNMVVNGGELMHTMKVQVQQVATIHLNTPNDIKLWYCTTVAQGSIT